MSSKTAKSKKDDIQPVVFTRDDGTIVLMLMNRNGSPSKPYHYSTMTGKIEEIDDLLPVEWIGSIHISPNYIHRAMIPAKNIFQSWNIPTEPKELAKFIADRGEKNQFYRVAVGKKIGKKVDKKVGSIYLPNLLKVVTGLQDDPPDKDEAIVAGVTVAPGRQRQGFGSLLHLLGAGHLKQLGYKTMMSDIVGMNTTGEIAVWKSLQKQLQLPVTPFKHRFSLAEFLTTMHIIDKNMVAILEKTGTHVNGEMLTTGQVAKKKFQQFQLDLTDEQVPVLIQAATQQEAEEMAQDLKPAA